MKLSKLKKALVILVCFCLSSCEDWLEIEAPDNKIVSEVVFNDEATAISAMAGIYNQLVINSFSGGWQDSVTALAGLSADELNYIRTTNLSFTEFEENEITPTNANNSDLWSSAYNMIYMTNSLLEGLENSNALADGTKNKLEGQAKFVRAFTYFYLVNLYGEIPLLLTTDYQINALAARNAKEEVYQQIIADLTNSIDLLDSTYTNGERTFANRNTAMAFLARVFLYQEDWQEAENLSNEVIEQSGTYSLLEDLDEVFLANSQEAIWQISPLGNGGSQTQTNEGSIFIIHPIFSFLANFELQDSLVSSFDNEDQRLSHWIGYHEGMDSHYAYKYKDWNSSDNLTEYSMVLRLAEQYLIRAEARARQGNLSAAITDVDKIRQRAGLELLADTNPEINKEDLIEMILEERRKELFTEWGHRWLDLKRTEKATATLSNQKTGWENTDVLYPIPAEERSKNPNLDQNPGY